jgi:hypothetical protein
VKKVCGPDHLPPSFGLSAGPACDLRVEGPFSSILRREDQSCKDYTPCKIVDDAVQDAVGHMGGYGSASATWRRDGWSSASSLLVLDASAEPSRFSRGIGATASAIFCCLSRRRGLFAQEAHLVDRHRGGPCEVAQAGALEPVRLGGFSPGIGLPGLQNDQQAPAWQLRPRPLWRPRFARWPPAWPRPELPSGLQGRSLGQPIALACDAVNPFYDAASQAFPAQAANTASA